MTLSVSHSQDGMELEPSALDSHPMLFLQRLWVCMVEVCGRSPLRSFMGEAGPPLVWTLSRIRPLCTSLLLHSASLCGCCRPHHVNVKYIPASSHAPNELLGKPEVSSPNSPRTTAGQLPRGPWRFTVGPGLAKTPPRPVCPSWALCLHDLRAVGSQALFLALGIQASAIPRVMLVTAVIIIAHVRGPLVCAMLCAKYFTHIIPSNPLTHPIRHIL